MSDRMSEGPGAAYTVAVRDLCEFAARRGDLDTRFAPSPTAAEGVAGHRSVASRRPAEHRSEVALSLVYRDLVVRGRADGYDATRGVLEEVKTFRGDVARLSADRRALHRAQADCYAWMLCLRDGLAGLDVAVVYYDVDRALEMPPEVERRTADDLRRDFEALADRFVAWAREERAHRTRRDRWLTALRFPHDAFRPGQHALASAVWRTVRGRLCLVAEAPTGIGKTVATLYPALKAMGVRNVDRLFFLTARGTGRALALDAADAVAQANDGARVRLVDLTAREKCCEHPDKRCHGESCPLARGFHDRLPDARIAARDVGTLTRDALADVARRHAVCPYWLGIEMTKWSDVVIGDYNHWFDGSAMLFAMAVESDWRAVVLVDEAHNLLERARAMYSMRLTGDALLATEREASTWDGSDAGATLVKALRRLKRAWDRVLGEAATANAVGPATVDETYVALDGVPASFAAALADVGVAFGPLLIDDAVPLSEPLRRFGFDVLRLARLVDSFGDHSVFDVVHGRPGPGARPGRTARCASSSLGIRNLVPAPFVTPRLAAAHATVLFSATLTPHAFYADTLGLPADTVRVDIPAPFSADQLDVRIVRDVSTRFADRARSLDPIATLVAAQYARRPGNYLVFVSSHAYLDALATRFEERYPAIAAFRQARRMSDDDRTLFLGRFADAGRGVGFAVLGGVFAEGIDLPGDRLVGAFVATLGLAQFDGASDAERRRHERRYGAGYEYTYLYPGIRRVVQAAGRVVRSSTDRGSLVLIDDRFGRPDVQALLPAWWDLGAPRTAAVRPRLPG